MPPGHLDLEVTLHRLAQFDTPLASLAQRLRGLSFHQRAQIVSLPVPGTGYTPLYLSVSPAWAHRFSEIPHDLMRKVPGMLLEMGADPFRRGPRGRAAVLCPAFFDSPSTVRSFINYHRADLTGPNLTRQEKLWVYLECERTLWTEKDRDVVQTALEALFPPNRSQQFREGASLRTPHHHLKPAGIPHGERILAGLTRLVNGGIMSKEETANLLNTCYGRDGELLIHRLVRNTSLARRTLPLLTALGASTHTQTNRHSKQPGSTVWHLAARDSTLMPLS